MEKLNKCLCKVLTKIIKYSNNAEMSMTTHTYKNIYISLKYTVNKVIKIHHITAIYDNINTFQWIKNYISEYHFIEKINVWKSSEKSYFLCKHEMLYVNIFF